MLGFSLSVTKLKLEPFGTVWVRKVISLLAICYLHAYRSLILSIS